MLNWKAGGPPSKLQIEGKVYGKAIDIARIQMDYFVKKLIDIQTSLGTAGDDPLRLLKCAFMKWKTFGESSEFLKLKINYTSGDSQPDQTTLK